jgi:hypothetical protein
MKIDDAISFLEKYVEITKPLFGRIQIYISEAIDVAKFPDELHKLSGENEGLYIIWSKNDHRVIYAGIAVNIERRIYQHIGKGFSWTRGQNTAHFPNCTLASGRDWLAQSTRTELQNANWNITAIITFPGDLRGILESALIFWGLHNDKKPEINVEL